MEVAGNGVAQILKCFGAFKGFLWDDWGGGISSNQKNTSFSENRQNYIKKLKIYKLQKRTKSKKMKKLDWWFQFTVILQQEFTI